MQIQEHVSEHDWSSEWVILSILAHRAHLAQSYFSLIFSAFNAYNCSWFDLTNKKNCNDWRQKHGEQWLMLMTFFLTAIAAITGSFLKNAWESNVFIQNQCANCHGNHRTKHSPMLTIFPLTYLSGISFHYSIFLFFFFSLSRCFFLL